MSDSRRRPHRRLVTRLLIALCALTLAGCANASAVAPSLETVSPGDNAAVGAREAEPTAVPARTPASGTRGVPARTPSLATPVPKPPPEPFAINLYRPGDFVPQYTFEWCVGASIQMTLAITDTSGDTSRARQERLWELARDLSDSPFGGANPNGWVPALNQLGVGPYVLVSEPDLERAVRRAATALAETRRPVGLVMWRGRHAWVMSGFESTGDPRVHGDVTVTGVRVLDPLYPHGSRVWGRSPAPNSLLTPEQLGRQFVARTGGRIDLGVPPGYLLVLPVAEA